MKEYYTLSKETDELWTPKIEAFIKSDERKLNLTGIPELNPARVRDILTDNLGYEEENFESDGWEWDYSFHFIHDDFPNINMYGTGLTFELHLTKGAI